MKKAILLTLILCLQFVNASVPTDYIDYWSFDDPKSDIVASCSTFSGELKEINILVSRELESDERINRAKANALGIMIHFNCNSLTLNTGDYINIYTIYPTVPTEEIVDLYENTGHPLKLCDGFVKVTSGFAPHYKPVYSCKDASGNTIRWEVFN